MKAEIEIYVKEQILEILRNLSESTLREEKDRLSWEILKMKKGFENHEGS